MSSLSMSLTTSTFILDRKCRAISFTASLCRRKGKGREGGGDREREGEGGRERGRKKGGQREGEDKKETLFCLIGYVGNFTRWYI